MDNSNNMNPQENNYTDDFFTQPDSIIGTTNLTTEQKILYSRRFLNKLYYIRRKSMFLLFSTICINSFQ